MDSNDLIYMATQLGELAGLAIGFCCAVGVGFGIYKGCQRLINYRREQLVLNIPESRSNRERHLSYSDIYASGAFNISIPQVTLPATTVISMQTEELRDAGLRAAGVAALVDEKSALLPPPSSALRAPSPAGGRRIE